jgi:hypothetical protein
MIRIKWIAVLLVLLAMGCAKEESAVVENLDFDTLTAEFDTFTAGFADANTKTYVDENLRLFWHEKDEISIFTSIVKMPVFSLPIGALEDMAIPYAA